VNDAGEARRVKAELYRTVRFDAGENPDMEGGSHLPAWTVIFLDGVSAHDSCARSEGTRIDLLIGG
jgi:hypothetical protein